MRIVVYIESLKTFTSGMPHRGMLKELINMRKDDYFILVLRKGAFPDFLNEFLLELKPFVNWELHIEKISGRFSNILALFRFKNHACINVKGDLFLNVDAHYLGKHCFPQIITVHDLSSVKKRKTSSISFVKRYARKFTVLNGIKYADQIVSISEFTKNDIESNFKTRNNIVVIYNGIDAKWHDANYNLNSFGEDYWVWWGSFSNRKNLKKLLLAYESLVAKYNNNIPNIKFVGNENQCSIELKNIVNQSPSLSDKVFFKSHMGIDDLIAFVGSSKGLLFPSLYEGFGLPVVEAFSQGIPVLTSNTSSMPEVTGGYAVLVNPEEVSEIKEGIIKMVYITENLDKQDLKKWSKNFTYKKCALAYSDLIDSTSNVNG